MTAESQWYEEVAPGVRQIAMPIADFTWLDIDLEQAGPDLQPWVSNPDVAALMREPFTECGRLRVAEATLIRVELPAELTEGHQPIRLSILLSKNQLVIARRGPLESLQEFTADIVKHGSKLTPLIVTCELLDDILDLVRSPISTTAERLREFEDLVGDTSNRASNEQEIAEIRRNILQIERQLDPMQTLLKRIVQLGS